MIVTKSAFLLWLTMNYSPMDVAKVDVEQAHCMLQNVYHEARSESSVGQTAVAHVTLNRTKDKRFPDSVCGVVNEKLTKKHCSFSWTCDGKKDDILVSSTNGQVDKKKWKNFVEIAKVTMSVMTGKAADVSRGANFYYNAKTATPLWASLYTFRVKIGPHVFLRREKNSMV